MQQSGHRGGPISIQNKNNTRTVRLSCGQRLRQIGRNIVFGIAWIMRGFVIIAAVVFLAGHAYIPLIFSLLLTAIIFALVRSRLVSFPLFLNRSLTYTILTSILAIVYFSGIAVYELFSQLFDTHPANNEIAVIIPTLITVALFQPLRQNLQQFIDKRFYRHTYNAEQVIASFSASIREEIDLNQISALLLNTIRDNLLPSSFELWLQETTTSLDTQGNLHLFVWQAPPPPPPPTTTTSLLYSQPEKTLPKHLISVSEDDPLLKMLLAEGTLLEALNFVPVSTLAQELQQSHLSNSMALISRGELVGLLTLGPRLSGQKYELYDQNLLSNLVAQAAPALRVAQVVREQQDQALAHERIEQELRTAQLIQRTLLPKELPHLPGCQITTYYQPAREVGGDFYDFHVLADGRLGIVIGDVADKGIPAALFMTTTCTMLRSVAKEIEPPGEVLAHVNELLYSNIPTGMFVTCFYAIFDLHKGELWYANAGHDLPYQQRKGQVHEIRATGMPLGLLPGMLYEEGCVTIHPGDTLLFYSDGLVEAHNSTRTMFGFPRLEQLLLREIEPAGLIEYLLKSLAAFTGEGWEQEDDVTLVTLHRNAEEQEQPPMLLAEWSLASVPGNEHTAMEQVAERVRPLGLTDERRDNLETAVAEAVMNAMEHGNHYQPEKLVTIQLFNTSETILVRIRDESTDTLVLPESTPDLNAKLAGQQTARGWGLFLIKSLVDELHIHPTPPAYIELLMYKQNQSSPP
jgi:serine phosphatase RsbU (regulator of sigma subunit)/anti-sigma regulatory factor (Ser/Thr protein kinase)